MQADLGKGRESEQTSETREGGIIEEIGRRDDGLGIPGQWEGRRFSWTEILETTMNWNLGSALGLGSDHLSFGVPLLLAHPLPRMLARVKGVCRPRRH